MEQKESLFSLNYFIAVMAGGLFLIVNFVMLSFAPAYLVAEGYSTFLAGFQNTLFSLSCVFFRLYFAPLADIKGRKKMLQVGMLAFVVGAFLFYLSQGKFFVVILARLSMGVGMASYLSSASCYVSEIVPIHRQGMGIGIQRAVYSLSLLLGPLGAIEMIKSPWGYRGLFLTLSLIAVVGFVLLWFIKDGYKPTETRVNMPRIFAEYKSLLADQKTRRIYSMLLPVCISYGAVLSYVTIYLARFPDIPNVGVFFTFYAVAGLLGNVAGGYGSDHLPNGLMSRVFSMVNAIGVMMLFLVPYKPVLFMSLAGILAGFGFASSVAVSINWLVSIVPEKIRGTALGLQESCIDGGLALGSFIFGVLTALLTQQTIYLLIGILGFIMPNILTYRAKKRTVYKEGEVRNAFSNDERNV